LQAGIYILVGLGKGMEKGAQW